MSDDDKEFSNNPADYNRVICMACTAKVKVHHMKKHLETHNMTLDQYKSMYGNEYEYVKKVYHRCGICQYPMLFDLETLFTHLRKFHQIKVKEYIDLYIGPIGSLQAQIQPRLDHDGAPIKHEPNEPVRKKPRPGPASSKKVISNWMPETFRESSPSDRKPRVLSGRVSDPSNFNTGDLRRIQEYHVDGNLISNDIADYTCVECHICELKLPMTRLRTHTKSHHGMTITEYKARYGADLIPVEIVWHRCGVCSKIVMLDSDHIAVHLKTGGHPVITHKDYNDQYMVDTRGGSSGRGKKIPKRKRRESGDIVEQAMEETKIFDEENNKKHVKKSSSLVITPVPSKPKTDDFGQTSQNFISGGDESEAEDEADENNKSDENENNGVRTFQLESGGKKLDVVMLFDS